jgi:SAM-dependent methyltransferase
MTDSGSDYRDIFYKRYLSLGMARATKTDEFTLRQFRAIYKVNQGRFLPEKRDAAVLDIGCGMGHFLDYLKHENYTNIHAIDIGEEPAEFCRKNFSSNVRHEPDPVKYLKDHYRKFEAITMNHVIEHLYKSELFPYLDAVREALVPGGVYIAATPNMAAITGCMMRYANLTHEVGFTEFSMQSLLEAAGFERVTVSGERLPGAGLGRFIRKLVRRFRQYKLLEAYRAESARVPKILSSNLIAAAYAPTGDTQRSRSKDGN